LLESQQQQQQQQQRRRGCLEPNSDAPLMCAAVDSLLLQVKIASNTYQSNIASVKHAEELMLQAGWRPQVWSDL
jgi:hypothetical protein